MRPLLLEIENFRSFHKKTVIDFATHLKNNELFLITGDTGSGKSTILDAMMYALYATTPAGNSREVLKSQYFQKGEQAEVRFVFQLNATYEVYRSLKNTSKDYLKKNGELIASKSKDVSKEIVEILGLTDKQFQNVIVLPQGKLDQFLVAKEKEKKDILRSIFQLNQLKDIFEKIKDASRDLRNDEKQSFGKMESLLQQLNPEVSTESFVMLYETNKQVLQQQIEAFFYQKQEELKEKNKSYKQLEDTITTIEDYLSTQQNINEAIKQKQETKQAYQKILEKEHSLKKEQSKVALLDKLIYHGVFNDYEKWQQQLEETKEKQVQYEQYLSEYRRLDQHYTENQERMRNKKETYSDLLAQVAEKLTETNRQQKMLLQQEALLAEKQKIEQQVEKNRQLQMENNNKKLKIEELMENHERLEAEQKQLNQSIEDNHQALQKYKQWLKLEEKRVHVKQAYQLKEKHYQEKKENFYEAEKHYQESEAAFIAASASRLADTLEEGKPCPVCGSCEHPNVTHHLAVISEQLLQEEKQRLQQLSQELEQLQADIQGKQKEEQQWQMEKATLGLKNQAKEEMEAYYRQLQEEEAQLLQKQAHRQQQLKESEQAKEEYQTIQEEEQRLQKEEREIIASLNQLQGRQASLDQEYSGANLEMIQQEIDELLKQQQEIKNKRETLIQEEEQLSEKHTTLKTKVKTSHESLEQAQNMEKRLNDRLEEQLLHYHLTNEQLLSLYKDKSNYKEWKKQLEKVSQEKMKLETTLQRLETVIDNKEAVDLADDRQRLLEKQAERERILKLIGEENKHIELTQQLIQHLFDEARAYKKINERYKHWQRLGQLWNNNKQNCGIETFIMGHYFKQMIQQANYYLNQFSRGRYLLKQDEESILNLLVTDANTLQDRSVATLSGGERFMCTLSLSLGMADVIGHRHSGVVINALFIDEGFGTLDEELLDQAMNLLYKVQKEQVGGMIGIISHISTLRDNINNQLQVTSGEDGSVIRFVKK